MDATECTSNENSINDSVQLNDSHVRTSTPVPNTESSNQNHCTTESQSSIPSSPSDIKEIKSPLSNSMDPSSDAIDSSCMDEVSKTNYFPHYKLQKVLTIYMCLQDQKNTTDGGKEKPHKQEKKERSAAKKLMKELASCKTMLEEMEVRKIEKTRILLEKSDFEKWNFIIFFRNFYAFYLNS